MSHHHRPTQSESVLSPPKKPPKSLRPTGASTEQEASRRRLTIRSRRRRRRRERRSPSGSDMAEEGTGRSSVSRGRNCLKELSKELCFSSYVSPPFVIIDEPEDGERPVFILTCWHPSSSSSTWPSTPCFGQTSSTTEPSSLTLRKRLRPPGFNLLHLAHVATRTPGS